MIPYSFITTSFPTSVKTLNGANYEKWKESLNLYLVITNLDLALRIEKPRDITNASIEAQRTLYEKWEHSNRVCLKVISYIMEKFTRQAYLEVRVLKII